jgi:hypothetical protein
MGIKQRPGSMLLEMRPRELDSGMKCCAAREADQMPLLGCRCLSILINSNNWTSACLILLR